MRTGTKGNKLRTAPRTAARHWRGLCHQGVCYCQPGFSGASCSIAKETTQGTVSVLVAVALSAGSFLAALGITMGLLYLQQQKKQAKAGAARAATE